MEGIKYIMKTYFFLDESPVYKNKYVIRLNHENFLFPHGTRGSFNIIVARLLSLSYAQHLRYCRDRLGAELIGKNALYVVPYFDNNEITRQFIKLLNKRMEYIKQEHDLPFKYIKTENGIERIPINDNDENNS